MLVHCIWPAQGQQNARVQMAFMCVCGAAAVSASYCLWRDDRLLAASGLHQISNAHLVPVFALLNHVSLSLHLGAKMTGLVYRKLL